MAKQRADVLKSYYEGHVKLRLTANAHNRAEDVAATVTVDLPLEAASALAAKLEVFIQNEGARVQAKADREARRKAWRDREVAAGRMKIIPASEFFGR